MIQSTGIHQSRVSGPARAITSSQGGVYTVHLPLSVGHIFSRYALALVVLASTIFVAVGRVTPAVASAAEQFSVYVTNLPQNTVTPISTTNNIAGSDISVGSEPKGIAITPDGTTAYVADYGDGTVMPITLSSGKAGPAINLGTGSQPSNVAISPDGGIAYVTVINGVIPISTVTSQPGTLLPLSGSPEGLAITPDGKTLYVAQSALQTVTSIDTITNTARDTIPVGGNPRQIAITPDGTKAFVTDYDSNAITPIVTATDAPQPPIPVDRGPIGIAITPDGTTAYVTHPVPATLSVVDLATDSMKLIIPFAVDPWAIAITPDGKTAYFQAGGNRSGAVAGVWPLDIATNTVGPRIVDPNAGYGIAIVPGPKSPPAPTRYVALGDSVPYGHGLSNPYPTARPGSAGTNQGPSTSAYPSLIATELGLHMDVRSTGCDLAGDQLSISGAQVSDGNTPSGGDTKCKDPAGGNQPAESVETTEFLAAHLDQEPADLVTIQGGGDDINFAQCLIPELTGVGTRCVNGGTYSTNAHGDPVLIGGQASPTLINSLGNLQRGLTHLIDEVTPFAKHVVVLDYYQLIPRPSDFYNGSVFKPGVVNMVDPVCLGLSTNKNHAYADATYIQLLLNQTINDAVAISGKPVQLVHIPSVFATHEMCTRDQAEFPGEWMPETRFEKDLATLVANGICHKVRKSCFGDGAAANAMNEIQTYVWRAGHPNRFGQIDLAHAIVSAVGDSLSSS